METFKTNYCELHGKITSFLQLLSQNLKPEATLPDLNVILELLPVDDGDLKRNDVKKVVLKFTSVAKCMAVIRQFIQQFVVSIDSIDQQQNEIKRLLGICLKNLSSVVVDGTTVAVQIFSSGISGYNQSESGDNNIGRLHGRLTQLYTTLKEGPKETSAGSKI